ncbi:MAG TPA: hypothetical protein DCO86_03540 [Spirochaetaceae bacterium]|nr:hypothetical protein [Spirochaetaceae bacterium]
MMEKLATNYPFIIGAFILSAFIAFIVWLSLRSQMKYQKTRQVNMTYLNADNVRIRKSKDIFLYEETSGGEDK